MRVGGAEFGCVLDADDALPGRDRAEQPGEQGGLYDPSVMTLLMDD